VVVERLKRAGAVDAIDVPIWAGSPPRLPDGTIPAQFTDRTPDRVGPGRHLLLPELLTLHVER
jgi:hypothetical protein